MNGPGGGTAATTVTDGNGAAAFSALRRFRQARQPEEQCELCSAPLAAHPHHEHVLEPATRQLLCSCTPCALLFDTEERRRYRRVPKRLWHLAGFDMTDAQWQGLAIPVNMAFFHTTRAGEVRAYYPSPAGATESLLTLDGWTELVAHNGVLQRMERDVEALLVNRVGESREHYLAPIDRCYELVGLIRVSWRGLSGGQEVWERINAFFAELRRQATERDATSGA